MAESKQIIRQGDVKIKTIEAEIRANAVNNKHKFGETLKKKQTQELNTMRFAAGQRNSIKIHATQHINLGDLQGFKPIIEEYSEQADHSKKDNPFYNSLNLEQRLEMVYGGILSGAYTYGPPNEGKDGVGHLNKRMVIL